MSRKRDHGRPGETRAASSIDTWHDTGHDEGGVAWGRIASLIETCKINSIEPFAYLKATLTAIANGHPQSRIDDLLPWNVTPSR